MMDGNKFIELLGHASVNSPLDDFLTTNQIKIRPKESGDDSVEDKERGLSFVYAGKEEYAEEYFIPQKSKGNLVLRGVIFRKKLYSKKEKSYEGTLPYGLTFTTTQRDVQKLLGKPKKVEIDPDDSDYYTFLIDGILVNIMFTHNTDLIECVALRVPGTYHRKNGLVD